MAEDKSKGDKEVKAIEMIDPRTGDEIALGISANVRQAPSATGPEGISASPGQKAMTGKGEPQVAAAPQKPTDSATSATPKK